MGSKRRIGGWLCAGILASSLAWAAGSPLEEVQLLGEYREAYERYETVREEQNMAAALPHAERAYYLGQEVFGEDSEVSAILAFNYGLALLEADRTFHAYTILDLAREQHETLYGEDDFRLASLLGHMGSLAASQGDGSAGLKHFQQALDIVADEYGNDSMPFATLALHAGMALVEAQPLEARYFLQRSYELHHASGGTRDAGTALAAFHLGFLDLRSGSFEQAAQFFSTALEGFESGPEDARDFAMFTRIKLVEVYEQLGHSDIATEHCLAVGERLAEQQQQAVEPLFAPEPEYPPAALARREEGHVLLRFDVDHQGYVRDVEVLEVQGNRDFLEPAVEAARQYRFAPRFENGAPVPARDVEARLNFRLHGPG